MNPSMNSGQALIAQYRRMHLDGHFDGYTTSKFVGRIAERVQDSGAKTLLDFGSGKGHQYLVARCHELWGVLPHCYDPAVPGLDAPPPGMFDGCIAIDVLEHIPEGDELDAALDTILGRARKFAFVTVCPRPARKTLPDGANCHVTVKPIEWWREKIAAHNKEKIDVSIVVNP